MVEQADADNKPSFLAKRTTFYTLNTQLEKTDQIQTDKVKKAIFGCVEEFKSLKDLFTKPEPKLKDTQLEVEIERQNAGLFPYSVSPTKKYPLQELWQCLADCALNRGAFIKVFPKNKSLKGRGHWATLCQLGTPGVAKKELSADIKITVFRQKTISTY